MEGNKQIAKIFIDIKSTPTQRIAKGGWARITLREKDMVIEHSFRFKDLKDTGVADDWDEPNFSLYCKYMHRNQISCVSMNNNLSAETYRLTIESHGVGIADYYHFDDAKTPQIIANMIWAWVYGENDLKSFIDQLPAEQRKTV